MGLSNFNSPAEGVLPVLVMNTVLSVALLKNMVRSVLQVVGANQSDDNGDSSIFEEGPSSSGPSRRVSITRYGSLMWKNRSSVADSSMEESCCCVCLCRYKDEEEVSELSYCQHFFHKACLEKWFDNQHTTCPLCRSIL